MKIKTEQICFYLGPGGDLARAFNGRDTYGFAIRDTYSQIQEKVLSTVASSVLRIRGPAANAGFWANWNKDRGYSKRYWSHNPNLR